MNVQQCFYAILFLHLFIMPNEARRGKCYECESTCYEAETGKAKEIATFLNSTCTNDCLNFPFQKSNITLASTECVKPDFKCFTAHGLMKYKIIYYCLNIGLVFTQNHSIVSDSPKPVVRIYIIVIFGNPRLTIKEDKTWNIIRLLYSKDFPSQNLIINIHLTRIRLPTIPRNKPIGRATLLHEKIEIYKKHYKKEVAFIISDGISQDMALVASELKIPLIGCSQNVQIPTGLGITQPIWISPSKFQQYEALKSFIIKRGHSGCVVFLVLRDFEVAFYNVLSETLDNNTIRLINTKTDLENLVNDETFQFRKVYIFLIVEAEFRKSKLWESNEFLVESLLKIQHHRRNKAVVLMSSDIFDTIKIHGTSQLIDILSASETYMVNTLDKMSPFELVNGCIQRSIKILSDTLVSSNIEISKRCQSVKNGCLSSQNYYKFKRSILQRYLLNHLQGNIPNTLQPMYIFGVYKFLKVFQYQDAQMRTRNWPEALMFRTLVQVKKIHLRIVTYLESPHVMIRNLSREDECSSKIYGRICYLIDATMKLRKEYCCFGIAIDIVNDLASLNSYSENNKVSLIGISEAILEIIVVDSASITNAQRRGWKAEGGGHQSILISSINRSDADVAVGSQIVIAKINVNYALLTKPYLITQIGLLIYRRDRMTGIVAFLYPFHWSMWIGIFITIQIVSVATTVYEWLSPYGKTPRGRNQSRIFSFSSALTLCWSALFSHTFPTKSPKCWSSRFLMNIYACFCVIFLASYTAKLAAYMVGKNTVQNIIGIHDTKIQNGKLKLGTISGSGTDYHLRMTQFPLYKYLLLFQNSEDVLVALKEGRIDAFVYDFESLQFFKRIHFRENFETVGKPFGQLFYTVAFSKNLDSTGTELNDFMSKIISSDNFKVRMEQRIQLWTKEMTGTDHSKMWSSDRMKVQNFAGPLIMMLLGFSLSFCALVLECIVYKFCVPRFRKKNFTQSCLPISQRFNRLLFCDMYYSKSSWSERHKFMKQDGLIGERLINHRRLSQTLNIDFKPTMNKILKLDYDKNVNEQNSRTCLVENNLLKNTKKNPNFQDYKRQISHKESQTDSTIEEIQMKYIEELKSKISNLTTENLCLSNKLLKLNTQICD